MRRPFFLLLVLALASCRGADRPASTLVLWAWERPEDLRFAPAAEVAVQTGFVEIIGETFEARGRRFPLRVDRPPETALVHVEINHSRPFAWTPALRARVSSAVLHFARAVPSARRVQIDFEVRESERQALLDLIADVRAGLPRGTLLSMTALASWCDGEAWLNAAPVDEIVPMLFRMQPGGEPLKNRLAAGGDFRNPRCRAALGVATDSMIARAPPGRRVYLFNPRSWTAADFDRARQEVAAWR